MIPRRQVLGGSLVGSVLGAIAPGIDEAGGAEAAPEEAVQRSGAGNDIDLAPVVRALGDLRTELRTQRQFTEIAAIRAAQLTFMRANGKLPDFIEVSSDIWFAAYDWHIRWQQPLNVGRDPSGRLTLILFLTTVILRPETQDGYMSIPYDAK